MTARCSQDHVRRTSARALAIGGGLWLLLAGPGCSVLPIPEKPRVSLTPTYGYLALSGKGRMDTRLGGGGRQQNPYLDLGRSLNVTDRDTAIGGDLAYGDGFQGAELHFLTFSEKNAQVLGTMEADFGNLRTGDPIDSSVLLNQIRLGYVGKLVDVVPLQEPIAFRFGAGLGIHNNSFRLESKVPGNPSPRTQNLNFHDTGVPMLLGRLEAEWQPFTLRLDAGWMDGDFGKFAGRFLDLALTAHYHIQKGISIWAGYWRYDLPGNGAQDGVRFKLDMSLQGYIFGLRFEF